MLSASLLKSLLQHRHDQGLSPFLRKQINKWMTEVRYIDRLPILPNEIHQVFKTHDLFESPPLLNVKYVFVYGDPLESALSVEQMVNEHGLTWFEAHQDHLRASGSYSNLLQRDVLNYQGQLQSWLTPPREDVICIDYDDLWNEQERLSNFLGFAVELPPQRGRSAKPDRSDINIELFDQLRNLKAALKHQYLKSLNSR